MTWAEFTPTIHDAAHYRRQLEGLRALRQGLDPESLRAIGLDCSIEAHEKMIDAILAHANTHDVRYWREMQHRVWPHLDSAGAVLANTPPEDDEVKKILAVLGEDDARVACHVLGRWLLTLLHTMGGA